MVQLKVGDVLDNRYRIDHPIARGGMSTVYRCVDLRLGRAVATKVMDPRYVDDPVFRQRFRREARAMAQLSHPNLVNVYDFGSDGDHLFLVMELIRGGTLRELLAERGPMPPHAATAVVRAILTGLSVAHAAGMVHRDIKPDNVLINDDHQVKLADFGLVRSTTRSNNTTDQIVGTVSYLSPEQVEGSDIGPASDVYSTGIMLFELLTGATPFHGPTDLAHAFARLQQDVPAPSSRIEGVPQLFDELVGTATSREASNRFNDAAEFLAALDDVAAELSLPAFKVPVPRNAAAHRAAAVPTDTTGIVGPLEPTGVIDTVEPGSTARRPEGPHETSVLPVVAPQPDTAVVPTPEPQHPPLGPVAPPNLPAQRGSTAVVAEDEEEGEKAVSNRSPVKLIVWLVVVAVLTATIAVGGWWFGSGRYGEIPQVLGMEQVAAVATLEEAGFETETRQVYHDDIAPEQIAATQPAPGESLIRGDVVSVLVSKGKPTVPGIPQDRSVESLRSLLLERTLELEIGEALYSDDVAEGGVVKLSPAPGEAVSTGSTITANLSQGPAPVSIPKVVGLSAEEARDALEQAGLSVAEISEHFDEEESAGTATGSQPPAGESVTRGTPVTLYVSNSIVVPDILGLSRSEAEKKLQEAGLSISAAETDADETADGADEIVAVTPAKGEFVDPANPSVSITLPGKVKVPSVRGKKVGEAREILEEAGFGVSTGDDEDERVYSQDPGAKKTAEAGATVTLKAIG
ncbi:Serine/threonine-protein kinase PK-1 [Corynebacterium occultum]|uniref:non-specific serine/threonine protein kinase n=1 Tax=Corynebacterium occultum TaxID=2675219 RepID=A0A6B8VQG1_9CORY|nr:Stk1 family PASTA domain-containing Ser/Thr kinase [Corynebacterium occultum]QGU07822.1 Serine/threonine-protein kinase PK-1 [Corynebacterium occultum]